MGCMSPKDPRALPPQTQSVLKPSYKILVLGSSLVGKTSIILKYTTGQFSSVMAEEFKEKQISLKGGTTKLNIFDTGGQERFREITASSFTDVNSLLVVFDLSNRGSFEALTSIVKNITKSCNEDVSFVLVGNKSDLTTERAIEKEEALESAQEFQGSGCLGYYETSAKDGTGLDEAFNALVNKMIEVND